MDSLTSFFKVFDSETGLWSSGGYCPTWSKVGKSWNSLDDVVKHLKIYERGQYSDTPRRKVPSAWQVIEFRMHPVGDILKASDLIHSPACRKL